MKTLKVTGWRNGPRGTYGIKMAKEDVGYFPKAPPSIEVEIAGNWHTFQLTDSFWRGCHEFRDKRTRVLRDWIAQFPWPPGVPPKFDLVVVGPGRFRLVGLSAP